MTDAMDAATIRDLIFYEEGVGVPFWRERPDYLFDDGPFQTAAHRAALWNAKNANKPCGNINSDGYMGIKIFGRSYKLARVVWLYVTGEWPSTRITYLDDSKVNLRWDNLALAPYAVNGVRRVASSRTGEHLKGAYPTHRRGNAKPWRASIQIDGRRIHLGVFDTELSAHEAYVAAAEKYFGQFARAA